MVDTTGDWQSKVVAFDGPEDSSSQRKLTLLIRTVIDYSVSSSSNKITIKNAEALTYDPR